MNEIEGAKSAISLEVRDFYGTPTWTKDGKGSLILEPGGRRYVGKVDNQLDDDWEDTIGGM